MSALGGFFGGGGKEINQDSHAVDAKLSTDSGQIFGNTPLSNITLGSGKNSNANLTLVSSDYGAVGAALNLTEKNLAASSAMSADGISMVSKAINNATSLSYDGLSKVANLVSDVINVGGVQNLEFLGKVENFSELAANHWLESAKLSDSQARYAMDYTAKENNANRAMLSDANEMVGNAYKDANRGLLAFADAGLDRFATMQNEAVKSINTNAQQAQNASMKALDMVFQSTKSADERTVQDTTKWIMGGLIAVVALVVIAPMLKGKA